MPESHNQNPLRGIVAVVMGLAALYAGFFVVAYAIASQGGTAIVVNQVAAAPTPTATLLVVAAEETPTGAPSPTASPTVTSTPIIVTATPPPPTVTETLTATLAATGAATTTIPTAAVTLSATLTATAMPTMTLTAAVMPTETLTATLTATAIVTATLTVTEAPTATPEPPTLTPRPLKPGMVLDFEELGRWRRGDEPYGTLTLTNERSHEGTSAARLAYDMPAVEKNYVVFMRSPAAPIPGEPTGLTAWVYGDGSGHYLNAWIVDNEGEVRQFTLGQIKHADSWQPMTLLFDVNAPWPQGHVSGPDNGKLDYPVALYALVFDAVPRTDVPYKGSIDIDEIAVFTGTPPTAPVVTPAPGTAPVATPAPAGPPQGLSGRIAFATGNGDNTNIAVVDVATRGVWTLFGNGRQPDMRGDGRVVFDGSGGGKDNLITINLDGSAEIITGMHPEDSYPSWSPSGESAVFYSTLQGDGTERIYIQWDMTRAQDAAVLKVSSRDILGRTPTWMQTWRIAFSGCNYWDSGSKCGIWTINSDGSGQPTQLTERMDDRSTDSLGSQLLYASTISGNWDVFVVTDGGGPGRNLTNSSDHEVGATFSPDGRAIAFISNRGGAWAIWVMNADGSGQEKLIDVPDTFGNGWAEERLSWGP